LVTEKRKNYEDRRNSFHEIARAGGAGGQATKNDGLPAEQQSRNQKRRPERPPQAEGLPHGESARAAKILTSCNTANLLYSYFLDTAPAKGKSASWRSTI
jgi:hypothetical protein